MLFLTCSVTRALSESYESMRIPLWRKERLEERERKREKKEGERFNLTRSGTTFVTRASATCTKLEEVNGKLSSLISKAVAHRASLSEPIEAARDRRAAAVTG